ncbi:MAG: YheU family protein [Bacillota bacterium]
MGVIVVPHNQLQPETLQALIEEFVTRDGAVHGHVDRPLSEEIDAVRRQLKAGKVVIVFDEETESCTIIPREQLMKPRT